MTAFNSSLGTLVLDDKVGRRAMSLLADYGRGVRGTVIIVTRTAEAGGHMLMEPMVEVCGHCKLFHRTEAAEDFGEFVADQPEGSIGLIVLHRYQDMGPVYDRSARWAIESYLREVAYAGNCPVWVTHPTYVHGFPTVGYLTPDGVQITSDDVKRKML